MKIYASSATARDFKPYVGEDLWLGVEDYALHTFAYIRILELNYDASSDSAYITYNWVDACNVDYKYQDSYMYYYELESSLNATHCGNVANFRILKSPYAETYTTEELLDLASEKCPR